MKRLVFITLGCIVLFGGLNCRRESMWGRVSFQVFTFEPTPDRVIRGARVSIFQNGARITGAETDSLGEASFTLPEGHYTAVAEEGLDFPYFTSDKNQSYTDSNSANGPQEFDITEGCNLNLVTIMDRVAWGKPAEGQLIVSVFRKTVRCEGATVKLYTTIDDAHSGNNIVVTQPTLDQGVISFPWKPGKYYVVATWTDNLGVKYTSDSMHVKNSTPNTDANGPLLVEIKRGRYTSVDAIMDEEK